MKNTKRYKIIVLVLIFIVILMSVAYAVLSTTLNVNFGNVTQTVQTWNVGFKPTTATPNVSGSSSSIGRSCGVAQITVTDVTITSTTLSKPGDGCMWYATIKNSGTIDAKLTQINATKPTNISCTVNGASMVCGNITYKITRNDNGYPILPVNTVVTSGSEYPIRIEAQYTGADLSSSTVTHQNAAFELVFTQN